MGDKLSLDDALKVMQLCVNADGGCPHCAEDQMREALCLWPGTDWASVAVRIPDPDNDEAWACGNRWRLKNLLTERRG